MVHFEYDVEVHEDSEQGKQRLVNESSHSGEMK